MSTKKVMMQRMIRSYKDESGDQEVDTHKDAKWAAGKGMELPKPPTALDILARQFSDAARQEVRRDAVTGKPYRANHAIMVPQPGGQMALWIDSDEAPWQRMHLSLVQLRELMVCDGLLLTLDADHWNRMHASEEPIQMPMDFTDDIEWRKNAPDEGEEAA